VPNLPYSHIAAAMLASILVLWGSSSHYKKTIYDANKSISDLQATIRGLSAAKQKEQKIVAEDSVTVKTYHEEIASEKNTLVAKTNALRANLKQLRNACPSIVPTSQSSVGTHDTVSSSLSAENREKLINALEEFGTEQYAIGSEADGEVAKVNALQDVIKSRT